MTIPSIKHSEIQTFREKNKNADIFLFRTNHGYAYLGFTLNGYGFISPKEVKEDLILQSKKATLNTPTEKLESPRTPILYYLERTIGHLLSFQLIFTQNPNPLNKKQLEAKIRENKISEINIANQNPNWFYTCGLQIEFPTELEELEEQYLKGRLTKKEFVSELFRRKNPH